MMKLKNRKTVKKKNDFSSIHDIRLARQKLRYESILNEEKLKNSGTRLFSSLSFSLKNLSFNIRNRLITYSFFRSLYKTNVFYDFIRNFARGFRRSG